jgi:hypothetical protein
MVSVGGAVGETLFEGLTLGIAVNEGPTDG